MAYNPQTEMLRRMEECTFALRIGEGEQLEQWQEKARNQLMKRLGLPFDRVTAAPRIEWTREEPGYTETRFAFQSEQDITVPCHLLLPDGAQQEKLPMIICLQGHSTGMHISLGRPIYPGDAESIAGDRDFARQAVARGYAALTVEQRGFKRGHPQGAGLSKCLQALLLGRTLIGGAGMCRAPSIGGRMFLVIDINRIAVMATPAAAPPPSHSGR